MLHKDPERRFLAIADVRIEIEEVLAALTGPRRWAALQRRWRK